jgi:hypothetical protein
MADIFDDNMYALQHYGQKNKLFGKRLSYESEYFYLTKTGGFLNVHPNYNDPKILAQQYDSLGRICPSYILPVLDTTYRQLKMYVTDAFYTELPNDSINITDVTVTASNFSDQHIECAGSASLTAVITGNATASKQNAAISLYPNPVQQAAVLNFTTTKTASVRFAILAANGKLIQSSTATFSAGTYQKQINTTTLSAGLYVAVVTIDGKQTGIKFIKQ